VGSGLTNLIHDRCSCSLFTRCLGGAAVRRRTLDRKVAGSTPGRGAIKSTRSTQPSIPPGYAVAVLGKIFWGPGPSLFGRQRRVSEITIEPIKNFGVWARFGGLGPPDPNIEPLLGVGKSSTSLHGWGYGGARSLVSDGR